MNNVFSTILRVNKQLIIFILCLKITVYYFFTNTRMQITATF